MSTDARPLACSDDNVPTERGKVNVDRRIGIQWRKSSRCATGGCVEIAKTGESYLVRDSKNVNSPILAFTAGEWNAFLDRVRTGGLDHE